MPTGSGFKDSMVDYGVGLLGGVGYALGSNLLGSGLIGSLLTAGLVGSMVKGTRGTAIATMLGFQAIVGGLQTQTSGGANEDTL